MMSTHTGNRVARMSVFQTYDLDFIGSFPRKAGKEGAFECLKRLVIKSDFQNVYYDLWK